MTAGPAFLRSGWGRAAAVAVGCGFVAAILWHLGPARVLGAMQRSERVLPICILLEGGMLTCSMLGLRSLYGPDRRRLSPGTLAYAGLVGYVTMLMAPAGRAFAEVARAAVLARRSSTARAAHAAYQMQAACLLGNAAASAGAFGAAMWLLGPKGYTLAIGVNLLATGVVGVLMVTVGRRGGLGGLLGRLIPRAQDFGASFDEVAREGRVPWAAVAWESGGRLLQTLEFGLLVAAVGGGLSPLSGLVAEGTHLVGAAVGDLIPAQIGTAEANFAVFSHALSVDAAGAVAIALLAHLAQLAWVLVGLAAILLFRPEETVDAGSPAALEPLR